MKTNPTNPLTGCDFLSEEPYFLLKSTSSTGLIVPWSVKLAKDGTQKETLIKTRYDTYQETRVALGKEGERLPHISRVTWVKGRLRGLY